MDFQVPRESSSLMLQNVADLGHEQDSRMVDPVDAAVVKEICQWFEQHGVAWSGTPGELAVGIGRPAQQVVHAIEAGSMTLVVFGISASLSRRSGSPTLISLHRVEKIVTPAKDSTCERGAAPEQSCENSGRPPDIFPEVPPEDGKMPATEPVADDVIWRNKLALAALSPTDDPPRRVIRKIFWIVLAGIILVATIWATNRDLKLGGGRIGSWLRSIASNSPGDPKGHTPAPNSDSRTPKSSLSAASAESALQVEAKMGNATAQYALGLKLLQGDGVRRNEEEAVTWFRQAANAGNTNAQFQLAIAYMLGRGIPQDYVQAYTWLTLVAKSDTRAQAYLRELTPKLKEPEIARVRWNLAEMYRRGIGVHADKVIAYTWYVLAEAAGETRSAQAKVELASQMTVRQVSDANAGALSWLRQHGVQTSAAASSDHLR
jgi:Sel1 repeat